VWALLNVVLSFTGELGAFAWIGMGLNVLVLVLLGLLFYEDYQKS